jgi:hypothetical protein
MKNANKNAGASPRACPLTANVHTLWSWICFIILTWIVAGTFAETPPSGQFGVILSGSTTYPEVVKVLAAMGAKWVRINNHLNGAGPDARSYLGAGLNVVITFNNTDPTNIDTTYGTLRQWPNSGFPYKSKEAYQLRIRESLSPLLPYLASGRRIWVQCENEVGDASVNPNARFWRGTTGQYLLQLQAFNEAVRSISPSVKLVLTSFPSEGLRAAIDPSNPRHEYATARMTDLLAKGQYDAVDLHFYGCVEDIPLEVQWIKNHMPAGKLWISTENGGPDSRCSTTPITWEKDPARLEQMQAEQVPARLSACANSGGSVCLWFSFFDLRHETSVFSHLGLVDESVIPPRKKPAFEAFKSFLSGLQ